MDHPTTEMPIDDKAVRAERLKRDLSDVEAADDPSVSDRNAVRFELGTKRLGPELMSVLAEHGAFLGGPCLHDRVAGQPAYAFFPEDD